MNKPQWFIYELTDAGKVRIYPNRPASSIAVVQARLEGLTRDRKGRNQTRMFEVWCDLCLICNTEVRNGIILSVHYYQEVRTEGEIDADFYYANRNRKIRFGRAAGDVSRWILKAAI